VSRDVALAPLYSSSWGRPTSQFMDGMDGLAATQTLSAGWARGCSDRRGQFDIAVIAFVVAAAGAGFLVHNRPPRVALPGDAGSTFLGFTFSSLGLWPRHPFIRPHRGRSRSAAPFLLDGQHSPSCGGLQGERIWLATEPHLYQRAVATGLTHRNVLVVYAGGCVLSVFGALVVGRSEAGVTC